VRERENEKKTTRTLTENFISHIDWRQTNHDCCEKE